MDFSQDVLPPTLRPPASDTDKENEHTSSAFAIPVGEPSVSEPPRNPSEEPPLRGVPLPAHIVADIDALLGCATEKPAPEEVHQRHLSLTLPSRRDSPPVATHSAPPQPQGPDVGDKRKLARKKALVLVQQFQQSKRRREEGQTPTHSRTERAEPRTIFEDPLSLRPQPVKESQPQAEERVEEFRAALQEATQPTREKPASPPRALSEAEAAQNQHERERAVEVRAALGAVSQSDEGEEASTSSQVPEDVGNAWPLQSYPSVPTIPSDPLVGRVVKVYWPKYKNTYTGDVTDFDAVTGQHHIAYRDGEMKWTNLREEKWKLTDDVARVHRASPKKQRKASVSKGVTNNSSEGLQIGQRIEVLFDDPPGYFPGTITGKNKGRWQIEYDDGYREELDLSTTGRMHRKYRLLRGEGLIAGPRKALAKNARTWSPKHKATELTSPVLAHKESKKVKRLTNLVGNGTQSPAVSPPRHTVRVADPSPPRKSSKSKPKATSAKPPTGSNAVGSRVGVWWEDDKTFYYGTIKSFDKKEGKHQILYEDDNVEDWLLLAEEKLDWPDLAKTKAKPAEKQAEPEAPPPPKPKPKPEPEPVVEEEDPEFEELLRRTMKEVGAKKLHGSADFRIMEGNNGLVRGVLEKAYQARPHYTQWHVKKMAEICWGDEHKVENFLLLRYRRDNNGQAPAWAKKTVKRSENAPSRLPKDEDKGLGCSKCRFSQGGCNTCGYYTEEGWQKYLQWKEEKAASKKAKAKLEKQKKTAQMTAWKARKATSKKVKKTKVPKVKKIKMAKVLALSPSKKIDKKRSDLQRLKDERARRQREEERARRQRQEAERKEAEARRQMEEELRVKENIDSVPCGKMLPWSKNWKKDYYNTEYSVAGVTVARKTRRECKEATCGSACLPCAMQKPPERSGVKSKVKGEDVINRLVDIGKSPIHAWGLFASEKVSAGTKVIQYIGELTRCSLADKRENDYETSGMDSTYMFRVGRNLIDATLRGGPARYINHSCDPNCQPKQFTSKNEIWLYAIKDIEKGEELFYDYKFDFEEGSRKTPCHCGAVNCRGWMN